MDVKIPIGTSDVLIIREIVSTRIKKEAPKNIDEGIVFLVSQPRIILTICGITRPIQPITPDIATDDEIIKLDARITIVLITLVLVPSDFASSSDSERILIFHDSV